MEPQEDTIDEEVHNKLNILPELSKVGCIHVGITIGTITYVYIYIYRLSIIYSHQHRLIQQLKRYKNRYGNQKKNVHKRRNS